MSNLYVLKGGRANQLSLKEAIKIWLISLFHVHQWEDERVYNLTRDGKQSGQVQIQLCHCGKRRSQMFTGSGVR